jgi:hypothetical protein
MSPRRIPGAALAMALAAAALLVLPAVSSAAPKTYVSHGGSVVYARVHGSNGYHVNFSENGKRYFDVHVVDHDTTTRYDLRGGPVADGRVSANLGKRGSFDLRFVPVGKSQTVPIVNWCSGPKGRWQPGYLVGRLRFRGERGYTEVHLHKVPAARETWSSLRCHYLPAAAFHGDFKERRAKLNVRPVGTDRHSSVFEYFGATIYHRHDRPRGRRVAFHASRREEAEGISISRQAQVEAPESTFRFPGGPKLPEVVEVTPPAPFSGSASFIRTPESTFEWVGDLSVAFPGIDPVRLAGPSFTAAICELGGCVRQEESGGLF